LVDFLDDGIAARPDRERLVQVLAETGFNRQIDRDKLTAAVLDVFDPEATGRAVWGSADLPMTMDDYVEVLALRVRGLQRAAEPAPTEELNRARVILRSTSAAYSRDQPALNKRALRPKDAGMFEALTADMPSKKACAELAFFLGGTAGGPYMTASEGPADSQRRQRRKTTRPTQVAT
jgi:hypothetical protein